MNIEGQIRIVRQTIKYRGTDNERKKRIEKTKRERQKLDRQRDTFKRSREREDKDMGVRQR